MSDAPAHDDHPFQHFDRTCAGCWAESAERAEADLTQLREAVTSYWDEPWDEDDDRTLAQAREWLSKVDQDEQGYFPDGSPKPAYHTSLAATILLWLEELRDIVRAVHALTPGEEQ